MRVTRPRLPKVDTKYGAPMGRHSEPISMPFHVAKVCMVEDGAYDRGGAYWGVRMGNVGDIYACRDRHGRQAYIGAKNHQEAWGIFRLKAVHSILFRKFSNGDIIALLPFDMFDPDPANCASYMHIGQHSAANYRHMLRETTSATPAEYNQLLVEMEGRGYRGSDVLNELPSYRQILKYRK